MNVYNLHLSSTFGPAVSSFTKPWETSSNNNESRRICSLVSLVNLMLGLGSTFLSDSFVSNKIITDHNNYKKSVHNR